MTVTLNATHFEDTTGRLNTSDLHYWLNWNGFTSINLFEDSQGEKTRVAFASKNDGQRVTFLLQRSGSN